MLKGKVQKIKFNNLDFILPTYDKDSSAIATIKQYQNGECSYAHLFFDSGKIMQFHKEIGTIDDIEFGEVIEIEVEASEFLAGILGETWM